MPGTSIVSLLRWTLAGAALLLTMATPSVDAVAQGLPTAPPPPQEGAAVNPMCPRLEAQLASIDRGGGGDPARDDQIRRYQDAAAKQQGELDRVTAQAKRMGCDSSGFFSLFSGQSAQCGPVNNQIQQMRGNLDQITISLERLRGGGPGGGGSDRDNQRRSVLLALAQNNCGSQYANAARGSGNFLDNLFGNNNPNPSVAPADSGPPSGTYRTVCVRTCDGFYFPISFATVPSRFTDDERTCKSLCPAAEASLFSYRNPGEDMNSAVSTNGQPYSSAPNAFRYRTEFNPSCSCKAAGQTWSDALKNIDDKTSVEQGDIIVTEERAKKMSQAPAKVSPVAQRKGTAANAAGAPPADVPATASDNAAGSSDPASANKPIRSVGPTFIPAR
jgi:hypothetical protein